jgi:4-hydroxybenzoate polyprenyltransferase
LLLYETKLDTIYACQDKRDDVQAGVKSTALLFGEHVKTILVVLTASLVACLTMAGVLNGQGIPYFAITVGGTASHLILQLQNLDVDDAKSCLTVVCSSCSPLPAGCAHFGIVRIEWLHSG